MNDPHTKLIVLRGPSGSGKSSIAKMVRDSQKSPMALVEQDYLRRVILREKDASDGSHIEFIKTTALFALDHSYNVIMEGIFDAGRYEKMFEELVQHHPQNNHFFYFDVSFNETLRRHQTKPNKNDFGEIEMRRWYKEKDLLQCVRERLIPETNTLEESVRLVLSASDLETSF